MLARSVAGGYFYSFLFALCFSHLRFTITITNYYFPMKAFDIPYFISREIRRLRGRYVKACQKGQLTSAKVLRSAAALVVFLAVFWASPAPEPSGAGDVDISEGEVRGKVIENVSPFASLITPGPKRLPDSPEAPEISAKAAVVFDPTYNAFLFEKNSDEPLSPASTAKIATALVALEKFDLEDTASASAECLRLPGNQMGLVEGEFISIENLLYGLLVQSSSDAACVLSCHKGLLPEQFVGEMNNLAQRLGLSQTIFANATGLDGGYHYSSAHDLALLGKYALENPIIRKIVGTPQITVSSVDQRIEHHLETTNELLGLISGVTGVKTGYTEEAGGCLVLSVMRGERELIVVVMGTEHRFSEAKALAEWAFKTHRWVD